MNQKTYELFQAQRRNLSSNPEFVAWWIEQYKTLTNSSEDEVCKMLNISHGALTGLSFCKKPAPDDEYFLRLPHLREVDGAKFAELFSYVEAHRG